MDKANKQTLAYVGKKPGDRDSNSWYTPPCYIESARKVMNGIGLDPFSSREANTYIKADIYYTQEIDAFVHKWATETHTIWMNPPYGKGIMAASISRFLKYIDRFRHGIVLVNNATETKWFSLMLAKASSICLVSKRISFISPDGKAISGNTRGQVFFYFGNARSRFKKEFKRYGAILEVTR